MFKTRKSDGRVFNDNKQRSDKHHGAVKPNTGIKLGQTHYENEKGLPAECIRFLDEFDQAHKFGELNYHNNGDFVEGGGWTGEHLNARFIADELNIPEDELRLTGGDKKKYVYMALYGKSQEARDDGDEKLTKQQRKEQQRRWREIMYANEDNPRVKRQREIEHIVWKWNEKFEENYKRTPVFFRGTSKEELEALTSDDFRPVKDGVIVVESKGYNYYPVSMEPMIGTNRFGSSGGITLEFDGDSVRDAKSTVVEYTSYPVPLGLSKSVVASASNHGKEMNYKFMDEMEIRVPEYAHLKVKNMFVNKEIFEENPSMFKRLYRDGVPIHVVSEVNNVDLKHGKWKEIPMDWKNL